MIVHLPYLRHIIMSNVTLEYFSKHEAFQKLGFSKLGFQIKLIGRILDNKSSSKVLSSLIHITAIKIPY